MDIVERLEKWFFCHCDNDWEHDDRIEIYNLDNPGWSVKINLKETLLEDISFDNIQYGDSENRSATWIRCYKQDAVFIGRGSYNMLKNILQIFLDWSDANTDTTPWDDDVSQLYMEIKLISKENPPDAKVRLRNIYRKISDIPSEHPQKSDLLKTFNNAWKKQWDFKMQ